MKTKVALVLTLMVLLGIGMAQEASRVPKFQVGLDTVGLGLPFVDAKGGVVSTLGINLLRGVSYRSHFEPLYPEKGSTYWEVGTILLIDPYVGIGYNYRINEHFYVGGGVNIFPLHLVGSLLSAGNLPPDVGVVAALVGVAFYSIFPTIHLGIFLY